VYFGTGQYITDADKTTTDTQSFYGVWDSGTRSLDDDDLVSQGYESGFTDNAVVTDDPVDWDTQYGWYINLPASGERVVVNANLRGGLVFFNTLVPTNDPCNAGGGGFQMVLDMENGGRPDFAAFDFNNDATVNEDDLLTLDSEAVAPSRERFAAGAPTESTFLGNREYTGGSDGSVEIRDVVPLQGLNQGRLSWQELSRD
jgi:type IV pilus assembly protein PilY1